MKLFTTCFILFFVASATFAKDNPTPKPELTLEQKLEYVTAQRDEAWAQLRAVPGNCAASNASNVTNAMYDRLTKDIDKSKWFVNRATLEIVAVPPPPPAPDKKP